MQVLIAEDDELTRRSLEILLRKWGYQSIAVEDGAQAWAILEGTNAPRLLVLDWHMPELDGLQLCRRIRERSAQSLVYVIILTAREGREDMLACLQAGADDYVSKPWDSEVLRARLAVGQRILRLHEELETANRLLDISARTDYLTQLLNRRALIDRIEQELSRAQRGKSPVALIMTDVDHFKEINDSSGHVTGDQVLIEVAQRIRNACRPYDVVGRFGGEEFLVFMSGVSRATVESIAERIRATIADDPIEVDEKAFSVSVSTGALWVNTPATVVADPLIRRVDELLYRAKAGGRNQVVFSAIDSGTNRFGTPGRAIS